MGAVAIAAAAGPAPAAWFEAKSPHFIVYAEGNPQSVRDYAAGLERFDMALRLLREMPDRVGGSGDRLTVYVARGAAHVQSLCAGAAGRRRSCQNVAGFYVPRAGGSLAYTIRPGGHSGPLDLTAQQVLFHEYSHHFLFANYPFAFPAWFSEGYAEFNATARFERDGTVSIGRPPLSRAPGLIYGGKPLPLKTMLAGGNPRLTGEQRDALYGRGWLLTHYLTFADARKGQLETYLEGINRGLSGTAAAEKAFGDLAVLDRELDAYLKRSLTVASVKVPMPAADAVSVRPLTAGEAAMMPVRMRSDRGVSAEDAPIVVADARRQAAPFPADPGVQGMLAEAEYDAGADDAADAAADRALAARPGDMQALLYKGRVAVRRATTAKTRDPAVWTAARRWFVRANRADPDAAEPLMLFYTAYLAEGRVPTANAVAGLVVAQAAAPQDSGLRFLLARQYLIDGKLPEGRKMLAPLAFDPHAGPDNAAAKLIALIDAGDGAALAKALAESAEAAEEGET